MGEADSRASAWMGEADPLVEHLREVARPWIMSAYLIRDQLEGSGRRSGL